MGKSNKVEEETFRYFAAVKAFLESGSFKEKYKAEKFVVLTVTTKLGRVDNLVWMTEKIPNVDYFFYTTEDAIKAANIFTDEIWAVPHQDELFRLL